MSDGRGMRVGRTRRARHAALLVSLSSLLSPHSSDAAQLRIPAPTGAIAPPGAARADIRLITADGKQVLGFLGTALRTEYAALPLAADQIVTLAAQSEIALPGGAPTWYEIKISTPTRSETYRVQVPAQAGVQDLRDLVGAAAVPAGDIVAGRLLPPPTGAAAGYRLILSGDPLAATWSASAGVWGEISGSLASQLDLAEALAGLQPAGHYLTTEVDPAYGASAAAGITGTQVGQWDTAYGWGDHAAAGYQETGAPGVAGLLPAVALGDSTDVTLALDGHAYTARLTGDGDLSVSAPPGGTVGYTVLYLTSDTGAWELSTPGAALWLDGTPETLAPGVGETWEILARVLPDGSLLLSARVFQ